MIRNVVIRKNGNVVYTVRPSKENLQKAFNQCVNRAGGMWNGVDKFTVSVVDENNENINYELDNRK